MYELLCKTFIKDYQRTKDPVVRERYGIFFSIFAIFCNIVLVIFKFIFSFITNSVSIRADALNNLSDVGSNIATLFGFKLSSKHPDADHPYGFGRMEYISGLVISSLIIVVGVTSIIDSIKKIINPEDISFSYAAVVVLIASILVKLIMAYSNKKAGKSIESDALLAAGQDSLNDAITTSSTLISLIVFLITKINIDAYVGVIVSILVIKSGIEILKDVLSTILGKAPDKELIKEIVDYILENPKIIGVHDIMYHEYGPSSKFMTLHVEVNARDDVIETHDTIDSIEVNILKKFNILTTIHMDPVVIDDPDINKYNELVKETIKEINPKYLMHDFRMVKGPTHINLVFDVVIPLDDRVSHEEVRKKIFEAVANKDPKLICVMQIEHSII